MTIARWLGRAGTIGHGHFSIYGTPLKNTIRCSKNHFFRHTLVRGDPGKRGDPTRGVFQSSLSLRLHVNLQNSVALMGPKH